MEDTLDGNRSHSRPKFAVLLFWGGLIALFLSSEWLPLHITEGSSYALFSKISINVLVALWVHYDAVSRNWDKQRANIYATLSVALTELVVPIYLVKSRGWKGALRATVYFILYLVVALTVTVLLDQIASAVLSDASA